MAGHFVAVIYDGAAGENRLLQFDTPVETASEDIIREALLAKHPEVKDLDVLAVIETPGTLVEEDWQTDPGVLFAVYI